MLGRNGTPKGKAMTFENWLFLLGVLLGAIATGALLWFAWWLLDKYWGG